MKFPRTKTLLLTTAVCAALAACGGGDDDGESSPTAPAAPTLASCLGITAGVAYTMTDPEGGPSDGVRMLEEPFEGATRGAMVDLEDATNLRTTATYWSQQSSGIRFWGFIRYDQAGVAETKVVHSDGFLLPLDLQAGQAATMSYVDTVSELSGSNAGQTQTIARQETWTLEGFEAQTLGGHTFANTCKIRVVEAGNTTDGPSTLWFAKGFGVIRFRHTDSAGQVVAESALDAITTAPLEW
ncbi:hypothetical protein [Rhizobacter sp. Root1221]|uniref:hypothetical protein n=1 Tax=Rhizobacter sp. Root1221 TaxID=1736433 RepID=UPI000700F2E9|nr:hypothetical protein [Rhizobacter sp. Root1221]KQW00551.1 hypothetical protein ASC87_16920 [Rhizobacter sp. Root1221]